MRTVNNILRWIVLLSVGVVSAYLIVCLMIYRITTTDEPEYFAGHIIYKLEENTGTNRQFFEEQIMDNRIVRLEDESIWYVSPRDHEILWPENPHEMRNKGYTIKTELKAQKLMFGGYSNVEIHELEILKESPTIRE